LRWRIRPRKATGLYNGAALCDRSFCARHPVERHAPGTIQPTSRSRPHSNETLARTFQSPATMAWSSKKVIGVLVLALLFCAAIADAGSVKRTLRRTVRRTARTAKRNVRQGIRQTGRHVRQEIRGRRLQQHGHHGPHGHSIRHDIRRTEHDMRRNIRRTGHELRRDARHTAHDIRRAFGIHDHPHHFDGPDLGRRRLQQPWVGNPVGRDIRRTERDMRRDIRRTGRQFHRDARRTGRDIRRALGFNNGPFFNPTPFGFNNNGPFGNWGK